MNCQTPIHRPIRPNWDQCSQYRPTLSIYRGYFGYRPWSDILDGTLDDLKDILGEESRPVGSIGACRSRSKSTYPTDSEYDGYDTDQLMLETDYGLLDGANGVTEDDDIYSGSYDFE
ncbi:hypothetical protein C5167_015088 [Papaver somniferum]|uniref:Uncharacterized protein n=1 Tax=Papaver somniferum TaxID=3469 RepID=A0A4Y7J855_PAPSO|nr:hypothetical protein C5167_015088 [Papaver somniferum]